MIRPISSLLVFCCALGLSAESVAQPADCSRETLQWAADRYIAAQGRGDPTVLPLERNAQYFENMQKTTFSQSILQEILDIDFHRSLLDVDTCQTFSEIIVTDERHPYVIGARLELAEGLITEVETIVTDADDWLFDAGVYLEHSAEEDWGVIPISRRDTRQTLTAAANAYFDAFMTGDASSVPWGTPCNRLEGGVRTGEGTPEDSCNVGVPSGMDIHDRRFVVDEAIGAVVGLVRFGENELPDSHLFRVENGRIRYVHTLTVCLIPDCGFVVEDGEAD